MLGTLAALGNLIPYFGGIITNTIAAITAFVISPVLFIKTCIVFMIFSGIDGYVINPLVYGKSNQVHPLIVIISVFAGGILWGILGIVIALPTAIIVIATFKYFKNDLKHIKWNKKSNN
jgi:predicted PurR-regulated permease PerM